jgi:hypothetical protein
LPCERPTRAAATMPVGGRLPGRDGPMWLFVLRNAVLSYWLGRIRRIARREGLGDTSADIDACSAHALGITRSSATYLPGTT